MRSPELLDRDRSRLLLIDLQEKLLPAIVTAPAITSSAEFLLRVAALFDIPVDTTEQYPRGLGPTVSRLRESIPQAPREKTRFSSTDSLSLAGAASSTEERDQFVLAGVETHVCVLQTAFDLLALGYRVFIVVDAVASRFTIDHEIALQRLRDSGATLTTAEGVAFEWCVDARDPQFKALSALVKARGARGSEAN